MGMGGRQPFPGTLSTIACPREPVCRYNKLAKYVQPARQPSPNADGETGELWAYPHHLFVLADPFQLGVHRFMLRASSIHTEAGIGNCSSDTAVRTRCRYSAIRSEQSWRQQRRGPNL